MGEPDSSGECSVLDSRLRMKMNAIGKTFSFKYLLNNFKTALLLNPSPHTQRKGLMLTFCSIIPKSLNCEKIYYSKTYLIV